MNAREYRAEVNRLTAAIARRALDINRQATDAGPTSHDLRKTTLMLADVNQLEALVTSARISVINGAAPGLKDS